MKILVLDNYDSFTYNLVEYLRKLGAKDVEVHRNREIELKDVAKYDKILLSPGPGIPDEAGILKDVIKEYAATKSVIAIGGSWVSKSSYIENGEWDTVTKLSHEAVTKIKETRLANK